MKMAVRKHTGSAIAICLIACLHTCGLASAQQPEQATRVELTPMAGYQGQENFTDATSGAKLRLDGAHSFGLIVDVNVTPNSQVEVLYTSAKSALAPAAGGPELTDVKIEYLHVGGLLVYGHDRVRPFFGATLGASRFSPNAPGLNSDTNFSVGIVGGVKLFLTKNFGLRLEARGFATQTSGDGAAFCNNGACRIFYDGDFFWQVTANAGLVIAF